MTVCLCFFFSFQKLVHRISCSYHLGTEWYIRFIWLVVKNKKKRKKGRVLGYLICDYFTSTASFKQWRGGGAQLHCNRQMQRAESSTWHLHTRCHCCKAAAQGPEAPTALQPVTHSLFLFLLCSWWGHSRKSLSQSCPAHTWIRRNWRRERSRRRSYWGPDSCTHCPWWARTETGRAGWKDCEHDGQCRSIFQTCTWGKSPGTTHAELGTTNSTTIPLLHFRKFKYCAPHSPGHIVLDIVTLT